MSYLEEGFDPKRLKVAELRNILNRHGIDYASNAKKSQLLQLFQDNITEKKEELAKEFDIKASDEGIALVDLASGNTSTVEETDGANSEVEIENNKKSSTPLSVKQNLSSPKSTTSTPKKSSASKKRKHEEEVPEETNTDEETPSKKIAKRLKPFKHEKPKKTIFDDSASDIDLEVFAKDTSDRKSKHEKSTPKSSSRESPISSKNSHKSTPKKTPSQITKSSSKKSTPIKADTSKSINESFKSFEEEERHFNEELSKIKAKNNLPTIDDLELAKSLGITIQGLEPEKSTQSLGSPQVSELQSSPVAFSERISTPKLDRVASVSLEKSLSNESTPKSEISAPKKIFINKQTPKRSPVINEPILTPKPRLIPIPAKETSEASETDDEEQEELIKPQTYTLTELSEAPQANTPSKHSITNALLKLTIWSIIVLPGLFFYWYIEQSFLVGYCGEEIHHETFSNTNSSLLHQIGKFLDDHAKPSCVPCPPHGRCFPNLELACYEDFIEYKPWNNFLIPGNKRCIPDTKKAEKLEIMMEVALDLIRSKNAQVQCGRGTNDFESGISVQDLHDLLLGMKAPYITLEEFEELWERSVIELEKEPEIIVRQKKPSNLSEQFSNINDSYSYEETYQVFRSTSLSNISLNCQLSNSLMGGISQYKFQILMFIVTCIVLKYGQFQYNRYRLQLLKVDILHREVVNKLVNQMKQFQAGETGFNYIGANQLRDLILASEDNLKLRIKLWGLVTEKVEKNMNVKVEVIEHHGEMMKVWKWIGV